MNWNLLYKFNFFIHSSQVFQPVLWMNRYLFYKHNIIFTFFTYLFYELNFFFFSGCFFQSVPRMCRVLFYKNKVIFTFFTYFLVRFFLLKFLYFFIIFLAVHCVAEAFFKSMSFTSFISMSL